MTPEIAKPLAIILIGAAIGFVVLVEIHSRKRKTK